MRSPKLPKIYNVHNCPDTVIILYFVYIICDCTNIIISRKTTRVHEHVHNYTKNVLLRQHYFKLADTCILNCCVHCICVELYVQTRARSCTVCMVHVQYKRGAEPNYSATSDERHWMEYV